ncbi:MAG: SpoIIE family protein phosphatase [Desulfobacterales bacterium]|nr:SpoIIE family protein phosphatase [Desulfobacterales bacterium]
MNIKRKLDNDEFIQLKKNFIDIVASIKNKIEEKENYIVSIEEKLLKKLIALKEKEIEVDRRTKEIESANKGMMESLQYATMIQKSLLPSLDDVKNFLPDSFFIWMPKEIVGGDIYYADSFEEGFIVVVIDCTGHGIPGALMTMIASSALRRVIKDEKCFNPSEILQRINFIITDTLQQNREYTVVDDGLDAGICFVNPYEKIITFAGAKLSLVYICNGELFVVKGDKKSIGYLNADLEFKFKNTTVDFKKGMSFYLYTDGIVDQTGGIKGFSFGNKRFQKLLCEHYNKPFDKQSAIILKEFKEHVGDNKIKDDITVVGFGYPENSEDYAGFYLSKPEKKYQRK